MMLPLAAFALASAGAVTTQTDKSDVEARQTATYYIHKPLVTSCQAVTLTCSTVPGEPCMYNDGVTNWQVFNRLSSTSPCNIQLYRP